MLQCVHLLFKNHIYVIHAYIHAVHTYIGSGSSSAAAKDGVQECQGAERVDEAARENQKGDEPRVEGRPHCGGSVLTA